MDDIQGGEPLEIRIICPVCEGAGNYLVEAPIQLFGCQCPACKVVFSAKITFVRAKRSKGSRRTNSRQFNVRIVDDKGNEDLLQFSNNSYQDMELRSKDMLMLGFVDGKLRLITNGTIRKYYKISPPSIQTESENPLLLLMAVIIMTVLSILGLFGHHHH